MYKALIIDDEKPVRIALQKLGHWKHYGIDPPDMSVNGKDALNAMRELHPQIIFVDMNMPVMDGCHFLELASKEFPKSQYIVVSGYDDFSYAQKAIHYGACDYLLKPVEEDSLNSSIEKALYKIDPKITFSDDTTSLDDHISADEVVEIIKLYIEAHYAENIKITMFADKYFFSIEYLTKHFRSHYGYTIYEYVLKLRMERAKELLKQPDIKIIDIAERLGYSDNHYFSKAFRTYYHFSPKQFRTDYFNH